MARKVWSAQGAWIAHSDYVHPYYRADGTLKTRYISSRNDIKHMDQLYHDLATRAEQMGLTIAEFSRWRVKD